MGEELELRQSFSPGDIWRFFKVPIVLGLVSLLCIALSISIYIKSYQSNAPIQFSLPSESTLKEGSASAVTIITVDIEGAVNNPGVYKLPMASRVEDAILHARGLAPNADMKAIAEQMNRAAKLIDGAKLYFPSVDSSRVKGTSDDSDVSQGIVNINTASQSQLESLSGVGPATAKKIIDNRPYLRVEDLIEKKAMGQAVFEKVKSQLGI